MNITWLGWIGFASIVLFLLFLDLWVLNRKAHTIGIREALWTSLGWFVVALIFNAGVYFTMGSEKAVSFFAGYLMERALSVDNLFVFLLIFSYFKVPSQYQHRVLFWGIFGALVMRAVFIAAGISLIHYFDWIIYVFGAFLIYTAFKLVSDTEKEIEPEKNPVIKLFRKFMPVSKKYVQGKFFVRNKLGLVATPLFIVMIVIETSDVVFAVDSIPAILAITTDPFIVYTSNVFAILGLRALYFAIAGLMQLFYYLNYGLSVILAFIGVKMLSTHFVHIPISVSLGVIVSTLAFSILASVIWPKKKGH
jgi:tellurite resistance protein TerC